MLVYALSIYIFQINKYTFRNNESEVAVTAAESTRLVPGVVGRVMDGEPSFKCSKTPSPRLSGLRAA